VSQGPPGPHGEGVPHAASGASPAAPIPTFVQVGYIVAAADLPPPTPVTTKELPLNLETVLRLADEQNPQIARAREHVHGSEAAESVAEHSHLPNLLRSEEFRRAPAHARVWQSRVEWANTRNEVLQDAGTTYIDWMTARRGEAITAELQNYDQKLLKKA